MELFILRHGDALTSVPNANVFNDSMRPLSDLGCKQVNEMMHSCKESFLSLDRVLVSPYLRAQQTYLESQPYIPAVEKLDSELLVPGADPYKLIELIYGVVAQKECSSMLLISHQPLVGTLLDLLCGFESGAYRMGTSSLAAIDMEIPGVAMGQLRWLKHAEH